ncbi:50S ribosomal protein L7ae (plasmid) [Mycobacterium dioxanotrophicus]|uniref:50S ribosomal protein L7ae n=1 Tax=Mycobacterium dioxanotrophicus TaxID=482462 RepID=A0A1Y0CGY8_9MYCO|nr:50S ribosomal protein L7ae [Mycobacterium dioxanotrophicus]
MPRDLHRRARAAVRIVQRVTGRPYTFAQFVREAFIAQLAVIARDYNRGAEIYPDDEPLGPGRRR